MTHPYLAGFALGFVIGVIVGAAIVLGIFRSSEID